MSDGNDNGEGKKAENPGHKKMVEVTVIHTVDKYHSRMERISVPEDKYHTALIKAGYLRVEEA